MHGQVKQTSTGLSLGTPSGDARQAWVGYALGLGMPLIITSFMILPNHCLQVSLLWNRWPDTKWAVQGSVLSVALLFNPIL